MPPCLTVCGIRRIFQRGGGEFSVPAHEQEEVCEVTRGELEVKIDGTARIARAGRRRVGGSSGTMVKD